MPRPVLLLAGAIVCFAICFLEAIGAVHGLNFAAWLSAGLIAFTAAHLP
jgi:hypothetical protein